MEGVKFHRTAEKYASTGILRGAASCANCQEKLKFSLRTHAIWCDLQLILLLELPLFLS